MLPRLAIDCDLLCAVVSGAEEVGAIDLFRECPTAGVIEGVVEESNIADFGRSVEEGPLGTGEFEGECLPKGLLRLAWPFGFVNAILNLQCPCNVVYVCRNRRNLLFIILRRW